MPAVASYNINTRLVLRLLCATTVLLFATLSAHAAEPVHIPAVDDAPPVHIPSPAERSRIEQKQDEPSRDFPASALALYLQRFEQELDDLSRSEDDLEAVVLQRLRDELDLTLTAGWYRFDRDCPLVYDPAEQGEDVPYVSLEVSCVPENYRPDFILRLHRTNAVNGRAAESEKKVEAANEQRRIVVDFAQYDLLRGLREQREFTGELYLERVLLREGFRIYWRWLPGSVGYANVILESLRARYPDVSEAELLHPDTLRKNTATLLRRLQAELEREAQATGERSLPMEDFIAVFPPGSYLEFGRSCPLRVAESLEREPAAEFERLRLVLTCLENQAAERLGPHIEILLPPGSPTARELASYRPGERILARLRFREILKIENGRQYRLVWDTIKEVQADS